MGISFKLPKVFSIVVPAAPITKLAFRGGGAKGAVYPGAIRALERFGVLKDIDTVAGSSAGSIIAMFVALGFNRTEIEAVSRDLDFFKFLDVSYKNNVADRGICDGKILYQTFKSLIRKKVDEHVIHLLKLVGTETLDEDFKNNTIVKLKKLRKKTITFHDLAYLNKLYKKYTNQNILKDLIITGTNVTDNELAVFSAKSTPNLEIAKAIRISASYPIVFKAVNYNGKKYIDGGAMDNLPVRTLHQYGNDKGFQFLNERTQREATLSFMLGEESDQILHHPHKWHRAGFLETIKMYLSNLFLKINVGTSYLSVHQALHDDYGLRTIVLPTGKLTTLSFTLENKEREDLNIHSLGAVAGYFDHREKEGVYYREDDFMSCLMQINDGEKSPHIYKYMARPFLLANPEAMPEEREKINFYVKHTADKVFKLTTQKKNQARKLVNEVNNLICRIAELYELNEEQDLANRPAHTQLKQDRKKKINAGIKEVQKLYTEYLEITDIQTGKPSTNPRHREILNDRLQSQLPVFNELFDCLDYYKSTKNQGKHYSSQKDVADELINTLSYFKLQQKKAQIIQVLMDSKVKYFQRRGNIQLLSDVVQGVRDARSTEDITREINKVRKHYKPRTFFSFKPASSFNTLNQLDKTLKEEYINKTRKKRS